MLRKMLIGLCVLAALWACSKPSAQPGQLVPVSIRIETGLTKASAADGSAISNVLLVLVKDGVLAIDPIYQELSAGTRYTEISCGTLAVGTYQVYAYGNIGHTAWLDSGVASVEKIAHQGDTFQPDRLLKTLAGAAVPTLPADQMLLTGQTSLLVDITDNFTSLVLTRPVVRLNVEVHNHANVKIELTSLSFSNFNPSSAYLLPHTSLPAGITYRSLPSLSSSVEVAADQEATVYSVLLYEGSAPSYTLSASVNMTTAENGLMTRSLSDAPMVMIDAQTSLPTPLTSMQRNQDLTVVLNVYYQELIGSFTLAVDNVYWKESGAHTGSHTFN